VAPEVLKKRYTEKCDVWSCGVIMYFLLCGHPPFMGNCEKKILEKVVRGLYEFKDEEWRSASPESMDLIRKLLEFSPEKRLTAEQALNHPWFNLFSGNKDESKVIAGKALKNLQQFRVRFIL
jgi:calcium-dependent protein kinase